MPTQRPRILIADDQTLMADLCKKLLEPEFDVVGTVNNGRALVQAAAALKPDAIVVDVVLPVLNGLDASQQVKEILPNVKVLFLTMHEDPWIVAEAFRRGASAYLLKTCATAEMVTTVREVLRGKSYTTRALAKNTVSSLRRRDKNMVKEEDRLTMRQREVLQLLAEGKIMKEIGGILNITPRTVAFHKYQAMEVLGAKSDADLVRYAVRNHMVAA
jgi:DNA-binding NarL/FixJ family response regulator